MDTVIPEDFPKTLPEFEARFGTEEQCREYLAKLRWPDGFVCPSCERRDGYMLKSRPLYECPCRHQTSLTAGTIFQGTRKPLQLWFKAMYLVSVSKAGISATSLKRILGFKSDQTAWVWLHKLRKAMVRPGRPKLSGKVEVDETFVGGQVEGAPGRASPNPIVLAAVERLEGSKRLALGRVRLSVEDDATEVSTTTFTCLNVESGSEVITDGFASYGELPNYGYKHSPRKLRKPKNAPKLLPAVHRVVSLLKRWLLGTHQGAVSRGHLPAYLNEFEFRFNRRRSSHRGKLVYRLLELAVATKPYTFDAIVAAGA